MTKKEAFRSNPVESAEAERSQGRPAEHVRWGSLGDDLVLLDLRREAYFAMNDAGAAMWRLLARGLERRNILAELARVYPEAGDSLAHDLDMFIAQCLRDGLLVVEEAAVQPTAPARAGPARRLLFLRAWWCMYSSARHLARRGFGGAYREAEALAEASSHWKPTVTIARALGAFKAAENLFLMRRAPQDCMPRSLALFRFLRTFGIPAEHCVGVRVYPFSAHAWVEADSEALLDETALREGYTILARLNT